MSTIFLLSASNLPSSCAPVIFRYCFNTASETPDPFRVSASIFLSTPLILPSFLSATKCRNTFCISLMYLPDFLRWNAPWCDPSSPNLAERPSSCSCSALYNSWSFQFPKPWSSHENKSVRIFLVISALPSPNVRLSPAT